MKINYTTYYTYTYIHIIKGAVCSMLTIWIYVHAGRVDGTGGAGGAQAPPHLFWIYIVKISKFLKFGKKFFFLFSRVVPPHKRFASIHPGDVPSDELGIGLGRCKRKKTLVKN